MLNMGAVLLLLIGVTDGVKTFCNATQRNYRAQCFGSLGRTLEVQMPTLSSRVIVYTVWKNNVVIVSSDLQRKDDPRYSFNVYTGILTIEDLNRSDNGQYTMERFEFDLRFLYTHFDLSIEAPVSSPLLSRECLSRGQQRVSCSAGGDGLHYSWSLDGLPLNATRLLSGPSGASDVTLEPGRAGLITCWVNNDVSAAAANLTLSVCQAPVSSPLLSRECLSRGQQRVSCSAGGDGLHYSWSLDGLPLNATRLLSGPSGASDVTLEPGRAGLITCWVNNDVSAAAANLTLSVCQAPVSSPLLSRECLSRGQQRVSCSAGGDGLHYSWSLDGLPLNATRLLSGPSGASDVTLEPGRAGLITCWVNNDVSAAAANLTLSVCQDPIPIVARSLTVVVLPLVALGVYWALKKKKTPRPQDIPLSSMAGNDDRVYVNASRVTGGAGGK